MRARVWVWEVVEGGKGGESAERKKNIEDGSELMKVLRAPLNMSFLSGSATSEKWNAIFIVWFRSFESSAK